MNLSKKTINEQNIRGIVVSKYEDMHNHGAPTLVYENKSGKNIIQVIDWARGNDFWTFCEIGDSIIKPSGSLVMQIKKKNILKCFNYH